MSTTELQVRLDEMWLRRRPEILERFTMLAEQVRRLGCGEEEAAELVVQAAHKLVSVLGAFGFSELARDAALLERLAEGPKDDAVLAELREVAVRLGSGLRVAERPTVAP